MKYSIENIKKLADEDEVLSFLRKQKDYKKLKNDVLKKHNIPFRKGKDDTNDYPCDELVHERLFWDACDVINELAHLVLDQHHNRKEFVNELKNDLKQAIKELSKNKFDKYY